MNLTSVIIIMFCLKCRTYVWIFFLIFFKMIIFILCACLHMSDEFFLLLFLSLFFCRCFMDSLSFFRLYFSYWPYRWPTDMNRPMTVTSFIVYLIHGFCIDGCSFYFAHISSKSGISIYWRHLVTSNGSSNPIRKRPILLDMWYMFWVTI